jgi:hypothetical protein
MRPPTFNFLPVSQLKPASPKRDDYVTFNAKTYRMVFSESYILHRNLDNCFIRFYYEPTKKLLGWKRITKEGDINNLHDVKHIKANEKAPQKYAFNCKRLLQAIDLKDTKVYKRIPVEIADKVMFGDDIDYITLR